MRIRLRFEKTGAVRFIGHLDFMRSFQKIVRLSGLPAVYTTGFNPHMILSFADPLGVGVESTAEYADLEMAWKDPADLTRHEMDRLSDIGLDNDALPPPPSGEEILAALNDAAPAGVLFTGAARVGLIRNSKAMAQVRYASWKIALRDDLLAECDLSACADSIMNADTLVVHKVSKKNEKDVDIRPMILSFCAGTDDDFPESVTDPMFSRRRVLLLTCSSGSFENLKPSLLVESICLSEGESLDPVKIRLIRTELYDKDRVPLLESGEAVRYA